LRLPPFPPRPRRRAPLGRLKHVVTKPAATEPAAASLWLLLLISAEIEELGRSWNNAEQHQRHCCKRNQRAASGKDAQSLWPIGHGSRTNGEPATTSTIAPTLCKESQISVNCITLRGAIRHSQNDSATGSTTPLKTRSTPLPGRPWRVAPDKTRQIRPGGPTRQRAKGSSSSVRLWGDHRVVLAVGRYPAAFGGEANPWGARGRSRRRIRRLHLDWDLAPARAS